MTDFCFLFDVVPSLVKESTRNEQTEACPRKVKLNNSPEPKTSQWRGSLHRREISVCVGNIDHVAPGSDAHDKEDGLTDRVLIFLRYAGDQDWVRFMRV